ncbi:MAG: sigma-70 family RNA polymerase sigma factor [Planctomycetes bacterium]|nr:sigma-70 family RNA polymerase sigma factor [Planctomycetota bacterium]
MTTARPTFENLLAHQEWVRALARRLVTDPSTADDIVQQTMLVAATRAPAGLEHPRGWLRKVAENTARALRRTAGRRARREQMVAELGATAGDDTDPVVTLQRAAAHKRVVDTLFTLPEPYHTVVLLRFFEDLEATEIAARLDRPLETVRSQLHRGLARMRERLDGEFGGDRSAWCTALLPLFAPRPPVASSTALVVLGAMTMKHWLLSACGLLLALGLGRGLWPDSMPAAAPATTSAPTVAASELPAGAPGAMVRQAAEGSAPASAPPAAASTIHRGRLLTIEGQAIAGRQLAWVDRTAPRREGSRLVVGNTTMDLDQEGNRRAMATAEGRFSIASTFGPHADAMLALLEGREPTWPQGTTDGAGRFEFAADGNGVLQLLGKDLVLLGSGQLPGDPETIHLAAPAVAIAGIVRDERGTPLPGVYVSIGYQLDGLPGIATRLRSDGRYRSHSDTSDAAGRFRLGSVPAHESLRVNAQKRGHRAMSVTTAAIVGPVDWTLRDDTERVTTLAGTVLHADGRPAVGARVDFGQDGGIADATGAFTFSLSNRADGSLLTAWCEGYQMATLAGLGARLEQDATAGSALQLQLGGPPLSIRGRLLDAAGKPLRGVRVAAVDAVQYGSTDQVIEEMIGGQQKVTSAADGRFELRGLSNRTYHVRAIAADSLLVLEATAVAAGTQDLELRAAADAFVDRCSGTVVDQRGVPVAGAEVGLRAVLRRTGAMTQSMTSRRPVRTDDAGRFEFRDCPRHGVQWSVGGDGVAWTNLDAPTDRGPVRLVVARKLPFRLTATSAESGRATAFEIQDGAGRVLLTTVRRPDLHSTNDRVRLDGKAAVHEVDERAAVLVLFAGDRELQRLPIALRVGDVNEIAY